MASIIEGYEYDIFISYRQKDNKGDRWVSEFVESLKDELESTFKEEISVYFDINPHDGLLETHDVDASLKEKLKCLVFIPIISRTYCDSKSFAWEHEFNAFVEKASKDQFGLKVKLPNGNVASRVLPVRIHDLDIADIKLCESILGGVLRGVEFIYKEPGVNKPLTTEDDEKKNLNSTKYRIQINKVANAIKEIILGLKKEPIVEVKESATRKEPLDEVHMAEKQEEKKKPAKRFNRNSLSGVAILAILIIAAIFAYPKIFKRGKLEKLRSSEAIEKSIAVLPFKSLSDDPEKQYLADGIMEAIVNHLQKFRDLRVIDRTSVQQYHETTKTTQVIGKELDVEYLIEGSFQKYEDNIRLSVRLIKANEKSSAWANDYNRKWTDIFAVQSEVAQTIAKELHGIITPDEKQQIEKIPTTNLTAYDLYLKGNDYLKDYIKTMDINSYEKATRKFQAALEIDSAFGRAYSGLASAYYNRYKGSETYFFENFLDSCLGLATKALSYDNDLDEAYYIIGLYYRQKGQIEEALSNFNRAIKINPNYFQVYLDKGILIKKVKNDYVGGIDMALKALNLIGREGRPTILLSLGGAYSDVGFSEKAKKYYKEALDLNKDTASYYIALAWLEFIDENFEEALKLAEEAEKIDTSRLVDQFYFNVPSGHNNEAYLHARKLVDYYKKRGELDFRNSFRVGYAYSNAGKSEAAGYYFDQQIKYSEESIKFNRMEAQIKQSQLNLAFIYAFKGDKVKAYKYLDELNTLTFYPKQRISLIKNDPMGASINKEERFQKILKNMEAKNQAEHERVRKWLEEQGML